MSLNTDGLAYYRIVPLDFRIRDQSEELHQSWVDETNGLLSFSQSGVIDQGKDRSHHRRRRRCSVYKPEFSIYCNDVYKGVTSVPGDDRDSLNNVQLTPFALYMKL